MNIFRHTALELAVVIFFLLGVVPSLWLYEQASLVVLLSAVPALWVVGLVCAVMFYKWSRDKADALASNLEKKRRLKLKRMGVARKPLFRSKPDR
jgi:hypothetical protein